MGAFGALGRGREYLDQFWRMSGQKDLMFSYVKDVYGESVACEVSV